MTKKNNIPFSGAIGHEGPLTTLFNAGIANELFPLILFIGIGAMIDFVVVLNKLGGRKKKQEKQD